MPDRPATEPTFTDTMQIGIVVPDLEWRGRAAITMVGRVCPPLRPCGR
jgi:hypothetical protein